MRDHNYFDIFISFLPFLLRASGLIFMIVILVLIFVHKLSILLMVFLLTLLGLRKHYPRDCEVDWSTLTARVPDIEKVLHCTVLLYRRT